MKSRIEFDISLGRAVPPRWVAGSPWCAIFLKAAEDDETCWDDDIRHPAMSMLAHGGRGSPKAREHLVVEAALAGGVAALVPEASALQGAVNAWGQGTSAKAVVRGIKRERSAASTADVKKEAGPPPAKKPKGKGEGKEGKSKGARYTVDQARVQLCFSWNFGSGTCGEHRREAHALLAELTNAPRAGRTSTLQGSALRLDKAEKKGLGPRRRRPAVR